MNTIVYFKEKFLARAVVFSHSIIKAFYPFTKEANKPQQKELLSQCHLKDSDPLTYSSSKPCEQNNVAYNSGEENSRPMSPTGLYTPLLLCQQGLAAEISNYIFKASDHIARKDSYLLQSKMWEIKC